MNTHIITTDDDPAIRKVLQILLEKEGYKVSPCSDGAQLLAFLSQEEKVPDLVLLDINMPGVSGLELLSIIRTTYPSLPVVMVTAYNDLDRGMQAMRLGACDYVTKPVLRETLVSCVKRALLMAKKKKEEEEKSFQSQSEKLMVEKKLQEAIAHIKEITSSTLEAFLETIEQKDSYTKYHSHRVKNIAVAIGSALGFPINQLAILEGGAKLHDIGKIGISEHLLNKKNSLTKEERNIIQMHPQLGEKIIAHIEPFQQYRSIIRSHHERLDGSGYPDGLKNDQISTEVRIISIADAFDAMTSDRAYRKALPVELAVEQLKMCSGIQFDADLVDVFIENELYML